MHHLIRQVERGPLQQDIYELIRYNIARTNRVILLWLRVRYPAMTKQNMGNAIGRLIARGDIKRIRCGEYRACSD